MRVIVVGLGVQGQKRLKVARADCVATVDPVHPDADFKDVRDVPTDRYDAALCCLPDAPKVDVLRYLLAQGRHVLVEKPLLSDDPRVLADLERLARTTGSVCYTAYNHRFEPHFRRMRDLISSGELGRIYSCRMFYGNGTARLVRESAWRDTGAGVLPDLGSHLLDTCLFWFGDLADAFELKSAQCFENRAPDHVTIGSETLAPRFDLEMTLLSWRNHFTCDVLAEHGSAHIRSLCKWGPSSFTHRRRILPSGRPTEVEEVLTCDDPTWALEYDHFVDLCRSGAQADLSKDLWLGRALARLSGQAVRATP